MSRLYPGWGSGKKPFDGQFRAYSHGSQGKTEYEGGDKAILPQSAFKEVSRLRLPFPLVFQVKNPKRRSSSMVDGKIASRRKEAKKGIPIGRNGLPSKQKAKGKQRQDNGSEGVRQMCGVLEFSAPDGQVYLPSWMMRNLRLRDGAMVSMRSVLTSTLPKGTFCKLQPHASDFLDLAASMNLRDLLESAFRNYSVLTAGETIQVVFAGKGYYLNVVETAPGNAISLYGTLDLEVDFMAPLDTALGKIRPTSSSSRERPKSGESGREGSPAQDKQCPVNEVASKAQELSVVEPAEQGAPQATGGDIKKASCADPPRLASGQPAASGDEETGRKEEHVWGTGRSLISDEPELPEVKETIDDSKATSSTECSAAQICSSTTTLPKRIPTYSTKTLLSFGGSGQALSAGSSKGTPTPTHPSVEPNRDNQPEEEPPKPDLAAVRRQRLAFFERLDSKAAVQ